MYGDIETRIIKTLDEGGAFEVTKLSDKLNEINKPGICAKLGYGAQCENLML